MTADARSEDRHESPWPDGFFAKVRTDMQRAGLKARRRRLRRVAEYTAEVRAWFGC